MWDTAESNPTHLSHDMACQRCGHATHLFLACSETCDCDPVRLPGAATSSEAYGSDLSA